VRSIWLVHDYAIVRVKARLDVTREGCGKPPNVPQLRLDSERSFERAQNIAQRDIMESFP